MIDDDFTAALAHKITQSHKEGPDRDLAIALSRAVGIQPRKTRAGTARTRVR